MDLWICFVLWNSGENSYFFFSIFFSIKAKIFYVFYVIYELIIHIYAAKNHLFLGIIWYSYNFGRFFMCFPDPYWIRFMVSFSGPGSRGVYFSVRHPPWMGAGGGQKCGKITCWGKKIIKRGLKRGKNAYFFPNWLKLTNCKKNLKKG